MESDDHTAPYEPFYSEPLGETLAKLGEQAGNLWLLCIYCERHFQARELRIDYLGNREGCAHCGAAGFDVALFAWDVWHQPGDPVFPDPRHKAENPT